MQQTRKKELSMPANSQQGGMPHEVRDLFNHCARTWGANYRPNGKLTWRLAEFCEALNAMVPSPADVLDFGCGTGHLANYLQEHRYALTGCDIADRMVDMARSRFARVGISWVTLPARWKLLPFEDCTFDAVVASSVFEYVDNMDAIFAELRRVLRPGGVLIFNVPNPANGQRKREYWTDRLSRHQVVRQVIICIPRMRRLLHYLALSKNRPSLLEWERCACHHSFKRVDMQARGPANGPLYLFGFRKIAYALGNELA